MSNAASACVIMHVRHLLYLALNMRVMRRTSPAVSRAQHACHVAYVTRCLSHSTCVSCDVRHPLSLALNMRVMWRTSPTVSRAQHA